MRAAIIRERRLAWIRAVATLMVAAGLVLLAGWLRFPASGPMSSTTPVARVASSSGLGGMPSLVIKPRGQGDSPAVREQVTLLDPTPMFLPTAMSSAQAEPHETMRAGASVFFSEEQGKSFFPDSTAHVEFPSAARLPDAASDWMRFFPIRNMYQGMGRQDNAEGEPLSQRFGAVTVARAGDGRIMAKFALTGALGKLPAGATDAFFPAVMEFMLKVDSDGLVGRPRLITSSGSSDQDDYFTEYLAKIAWLGFRLSSGTYIVTVGP